MHVTEDPVVEECSSSEKRGGDYVRITFRPDFERFGMMDGLDDDAVGLISKRAYDVSLSPVIRNVIRSTNLAAASCPPIPIIVPRRIILHRLRDRWPTRTVRG